MLQPWSSACFYPGSQAWDCQASSLLALDSAPEQLPSSPLHTSVVAKHELQALSLELAAWMQRWSGAWGRERPGAGAQDMVAAAAENMVAMIAALEERAMQVVIQDASSAGTPIPSLGLSSPPPHLPFPS